MKERYYTAMPATLPATVKAPGRPPAGDITRLHAVNWLLAVGILTLCLGVGAWVAAKTAGAPVTAWQLALAPLAAGLAAGVAFAVKLLQFTEEHRAWLYALEIATGRDLDGDGITGKPERANPPGQPRPPLAGALVRGVDGAMHRIDTDLTPLELQAVKRHLLTSGAFTVRAVNDLLGDESRASSLRVELHRLGILEPPRPRVATKLTNAGKRAVMRWA